MQELLAPRNIRFYDRNWAFLGGRWKRLEMDHRGRGFENGAYCSSWDPLDPGSSICFSALISEVTHIYPGIISAFTIPSQFSVAESMSWAAGRVTTRSEDRAYCLLGLFTVNMSLLYGEGDKAFARLQNAIIEAKDDQNIFAWDYGLESSYSGNHDSGCLAHSVSEYTNGHHLRQQDGLDLACSKVVSHYF